MKFLERNIKFGYRQPIWHVELEESKMWLLKEQAAKKLYERPYFACCMCCHTSVVIEPEDNLDYNYFTRESLGEPLTWFYKRIVEEISDYEAVKKYQNSFKLV